MVASGSRSFRNVPLPNNELLRFEHGESRQSRIGSALSLCGYLSTYGSVFICNLLHQNSEANRK